MSAPRVLGLRVEGGRIALRDGEALLAEVEARPIEWTTVQVYDALRLRSPHSTRAQTERLRALVEGYLLPSALRTAVERIAEPIYLVAEPGPELDGLPLELISGARVAVCRRKATQVAPRLEDGEPLRVLMFLTSSVGAAVTSTLLEEEAIATALGDGVVMEIEDSGQLGRLRQLLDGFRPHLLHVVGHGRLAGGSIELLAEAQPGRAGWAPLEPPIMAASLAGWMPRVVYLSMCSALADPGSELGSFATRLIEAGCAAVVGFQGLVADRTALAAARAFYEAIGHGEALGAAYRAALIDRDAIPTLAIGDEATLSWRPLRGGAVRGRPPLSIPYGLEIQIANAWASLDGSVAPEVASWLARRCGLTGRAVPALAETPVQVVLRPEESQRRLSARLPASSPAERARLLLACGGCLPALDAAIELAERGATLEQVIEAAHRAVAAAAGPVLELTDRDREVLARCLIRYVTPTLGSPEVPAELRSAELLQRSGDQWLPSPAATVACRSVVAAAVRGSVEPLLKRALDVIVWARPREGQERELRGALALLATLPIEEQLEILLRWRVRFEREGFAMVLAAQLDRLVGRLTADHAAHATAIVAALAAARGELGEAERRLAALGGGPRTDAVARELALCHGFARARADAEGALDELCARASSETDPDARELFEVHAIRLCLFMGQRQRAQELCLARLQPPRSGTHRDQAWLRLAVLDPGAIASVHSTRAASQPWSEIGDPLIHDEVEAHLWPVDQLADQPVSPVAMIAHLDHGLPTVAWQARAILAVRLHADGQREAARRLSREVAGELESLRLRTLLLLGMRACGAGAHRIGLSAFDLMADVEEPKAIWDMRMLSWHLAALAMSASALAPFTRSLCAAALGGDGVDVLFLIDAAHRVAGLLAASREWQALGRFGGTLHQHVGLDWQFRVYCGAATFHVSGEAGARLLDATAYPAAIEFDAAHGHIFPWRLQAWLDTVCSETEGRA